MLFRLHQRSFSITRFFIYNVMNLAISLAISCSYFGHLCNMVICVQFLVVDVKMNYVDRKFIPGGSAQSISQNNFFY
jgi:hypothetical protein